MSEKLLDALLKAEELELEGKKFYLKAAEKTLIPSVKELFKYLAYEEDLHLFWSKTAWKSSGSWNRSCSFRESFKFGGKIYKILSKAFWKN